MTEEYSNEEPYVRRIHVGSSCDPQTPKTIVDHADGVLTTCVRSLLHPRTNT